VRKEGKNWGKVLGKKRFFWRWRCFGGKKNGEWVRRKKIKNKKKSGEEEWERERDAESQTVFGGGRKMFFSEVDADRWGGVLIAVILNEFKWMA